MASAATSHLSPANKQLFGDILLERAVITRNQLEEALSLKAQRGGYLGQALMQLGYVNARDVAAALVIQSHIPYIAIDQYEIGQDILRLIPREIAYRHHVMPLDRVNGILSLVMADPLDEAMTMELSEMTHCRIVPFIAAVDQINAAIQRAYGPDRD